MSRTTLIDVTLHDVGEGLAEAEIVEWLVAPGQAVTEDQAIVVISTDKASVELPAPASGVLREQAVPAGTTVTVGTLLARIEVPERATGKLELASSASHATPEPAAAPAPSSPVRAPAQMPAVAAAPSTRRLAQQLGVDLTRLAGSGPNGRILDDDVRRAAAGGSTAPGAPAAADRSGQPDEERVALSRARLATARAVAAAWQEVPHIVEFRQIDATGLQRAREAYRAQAEREGVRLTYLPFFVKAASIALTKHPSFNASLDLQRGEAVYRRRCHIGIATAGEAGLLVPVLRDAQTLSIMELARALDTLVDRARRHMLSPDDLAAGTFTITNFGSYGTWLGTPIIRAPEVAIAGFGRIQPGVLAVDGAAAVRPVLPLCVATDHRINDGVHLAAFLDTLAEVLSSPALSPTTSFDGGAHA